MKNVSIWRNVWQRWDDQSAYSSNLEKIQLRELYLAVLALKTNPKIKQGISSLRVYFIHSLFKFSYSNYLIDSAPTRGHSSSKDVTPLPLHLARTATSSPLIKTQIPPPQARINVIRYSIYSFSNHLFIIVNIIIINIIFIII